MKKTALLLITILSFAITLTSCEAEYLDDPCYDCDNTGNNGGGNGNNGGNTVNPIFDTVSDAPVTEEFLTDGGLLIQSGSLAAEYAKWINQCEDNYFAVKIVPTVQSDGQYRTNLTTGAQYYTVLADDPKP